jgi:glyoxylase-like metal-dependent hydrolase (beta-lactamase superfamily II)
MKGKAPRGDAGVRDLIDEELGLLARCRPAEDKITARVHLFPAPGVSPGSAGLLIVSGSTTAVIAGDAVLSKEHFEAGRVFEQAADAQLAQESLAEIAEIADDVVPGHDNAFRVFGR